MVVFSDSHPNKTLEKLNLQRLTSAFTDVTVNVAGRHFSLHKSLLAAYSSVFSSALSSNVAVEAASDINLDGVEAEYFSIIIDFIYTSKLDVTSNNVENVQTVAQFLQIQDVIDLCNQFQKEVLMNENSSEKVDRFIKQRTSEDKEVKSNQQKETVMTPMLQENSQGSSSQQKQIASMMVEVYGSKDGTFALENDKAKSSGKSTIVREEPEEASKAKRRGRKPQARVTCEVCNKTFTRPKYEVHKRLHTGEKPYKCNACNKQFASIYNLKIHERIHTGERPYHCKLCNKSFSDPSTTRKHVLWHAGVKNKQCDLCGKYFSTMTQVREHRRSHTKEKPYVCPECGKAYGYRCDLKRHMREHTGDLIGPCEECGKYFNHRGNYLSHLKAHARKTSATQLKLQDSGLVTTDGRMILKAKICDAMLMLPTQDGSSGTADNSDVTIQQRIPNNQSTTQGHETQKLASTVDENEIEVTINDGKLFVKHSNVSQNGTILDGGQIILKDEGLSVSPATTPSDQQGQIFNEQCEAALSADQVLMLVQHAQTLEMTSTTIEESKSGSGTSHDEEILLNNDDETLVVVDGTI